ncbi:MAG: cysteine methyltransferase [Planctomyces sp.]|nr:cysteine methyltransferase [Planctomyces sp.]
MLNYAVFSTELGYWGMAGSDRTVHAIVIGHPDELSAVKALREKMSPSAARPLIPSDWYPELREALERFAAGEPIAFHDIDVQLPERLTKFQAKVLNQTRKLKYGETVSYLELAKRVGHPGAARAVGSVMANNALPILIPCHRVLGAGGKLGGFSAPRGTDLKRELLHMEDAAHAALL